MRWAAERAAAARLAAGATVAQAGEDIIANRATASATTTLLLGTNESCSGARRAAETGRGANRSPAAAARHKASAMTAIAAQPTRLATRGTSRCSKNALAVGTRKAQPLS